ncbi:response regulator receiver modulated diguanylate cyclase/phosphodiesterase with PAS/PAC sensor(s) [mine drainage metagenome]|uniref:Response regulator receiver modulated diguanylate cyclase/phosphodiesterase with PAS/PAC sensor(S) n=2 Tax=mine drainage metagenome TaxID=410659 RepID=T1CZC8_9ZZZZ
MLEPVTGYQHVARASIRVLLIEDNPDDVALVTRALERDGISAEVVTVCSFEEFRDRLSRSSWDLIISDYSLRSFNAFKCLDLCNSMNLDIPFILVSGTIGEETAVEIMKAGAHDYIMKDRLIRLAPAITRELRDAEVRKTSRAAQQALFSLAHLDSVTGLSNRSNFLAQLSEHSQKSPDTGFAIYVLDVPDLMRVQRVFGQASYDSAVRVVAARLKKCLTDAISLGRVGDHTFALAAATFQPEIETACKTILEQLVKPIDVGFSKFHVDAYLGVAMHATGDGDPQQSFRHALFAVRQAYQAHTPYCVYLASAEHEESDLMVLMGELSNALETNQIQLYYQPYVNLKDGSIAGVEGLVRWQHPQHGLILPGRFLPMAEQSELIQPLTQRIIREAITQELAWSRSGTPIEISINLSIRNLPEKSLPGMITRLITENGLSPHLFVFEITESMFMDHFSESLVSLMQLHDAGFRIVIDDFGTGFSALAYLKRLPIDRIKIDRTFIMDLPNNRTDRAIVNTLIDLAHRLDFEIVAEGVESEAVLTLLKDLDCDKAQGYIYTQPLPADELSHWIRKSRLRVAQPHLS